MRSHIGPEGPSRCKAKTPESCPFEPDGEGTNHFDTIAEARTEYENRLKKAYNEVPTLQAKKQRLNKVEQMLREQNAKIAKSLVEARAQSFEGVTFDDANPERAKRRLNEAIEYANSRHNEHLVAKLSTASVLPSGAFKTADGKRVNTDAILEKDQFAKHIEEERKRVLSAVGNMLRDEKNQNTLDKFTFKGKNGTYSLTIKEGLNEDEFEKLPKKLRDECMTEKDSLNIDLAREKLSPEKLRQITTTSQVLDVIHGKPRDVGKDDHKVSTNFEGNTADEKLNSAVKNISDFYDKAIDEKGKLKENKTYISEGKEAIKAVTANNKKNTFIPARSQYNGALVSGRTNISTTEARKILTPEEIESITVKSPTIDPSKAEAILTPETFGKIFKSKVASLRVTESK